MIIFYTFTKMSFVELLAIAIFGPSFRIIPGDTLARPPLDSPIAWILGFLTFAVWRHSPFSLVDRCRHENLSVE
jgi:hypothetical protein